MIDLADTLAERGARYGDFTDHAELAQAIQDLFRSMPNWREGNLSSSKRQALTVIADKIARIGTGDPEYRDNFHDIAGYAKLAEDRCVDTSAPGLPLEPADDTDGWIDWNGGDQPSVLPRDQRIDIRLRSGTVMKNLYPGGCGWLHEYGPSDIVAYKVVE